MQFQCTIAQEEDVLCQRCHQRRATGTTSTASFSEEGFQSETVEHVCSDCFSAHVAESRKRAEEAKAETERSARDGTLFEEIRQELATRGPSFGPEELAHAATYLDQVASVLPVPLPDDLQSFADKHRAPAA